MNATEKLAKRIIANYDNPLQTSTIDLPAHVESLLQSLGATTSDSGGKVTYYGSDPITPDRLPYGAMSAISLAAKAILIAKIWKERTGEGQDIHVDVRKALRRLTPFLEGKWELVNGFPGRTDPYSPFSISAGPDIVPTRDGKWTMLADDRGRRTNQYFSTHLLLNSSERTPPCHKNQQKNRILSARN